ncbi:MAG: roadblock/LC7 domain-containing protein [Chloroflexi bacterium]|nr:roadblock/LC7 domain-containing protein [Chloroflexota bacterium]
MDPHLSSLIVGPEEGGMISRTLGHLVAGTEASYGMVLDRAGQIIAAEGDAYRAEGIPLGALLAGTFASSREVARLLKEKDFRVLFQEGRNENLFTELVDDQWILVVVFKQQAHLGLVKILSRKATKELEAVLLMVRAQNVQRRADLAPTLRTVGRDTVDLIFKAE